MTGRIGAEQLAGERVPEKLTDRSLEEMLAWCADAREGDEVLVPVRLFCALVTEIRKQRRQVRS